MLNINKSFVVFFILFFCLLVFVNIANAEERTFYATDVQSSQCLTGSQFTSFNYTLDDADLIIIKGTGFGTTEDELAGPHACWGGQYIGGVFIKNSTTYSRIECFTFNIDNQPIGKSLILWNDSEIKFYAPKSISNNTYIDNGIRLRIYDTYNGSRNFNCKTATLNLSPICSAFTYSDWTSCSVNGTQTRTIVSSLPIGCSGGNSILIQSCTPICTANDYSCSDWSSCLVNSSQTRICNKTSNCDGGIQMPAILQSCTYTPPTCNSWTYSSWSDCQTDSTQTRTITNSSPDGCAGGNPVLTQSCSYIPFCTVDDYSCGDWSACLQNGRQTRVCNKIKNCQDGAVSITTTQSCTYIPTCTSYSWSCGSWSTCSSNSVKIRICNKISSCEGGTSSPTTTQSCTYTPPCSQDTWRCGSWGSCSPQGIQTRSCSKTYDCPSAETAVPATAQYCQPSNSPIYQSPADTQNITNQESIIRATVKLKCPVNFTSRKEATGTVIDSKGTILTNEHVIANTAGCVVGFVDSYEDDPYFGDKQIADIYKVSANEDIALLKLRNPNNKILPFIDISQGNNNSLKPTDKLVIYGYPGIGGDTITVTPGYYNGKSGNFLKTDAKIAHGNSEGGAYTTNGIFMGIPTGAIPDDITSLGYILSINTINSWINNSPIVYSPPNTNNYSRVASMLENMTVDQIDQLQPYVPGTEPTTPSQENKVDDSDNKITSNNEESVEQYSAKKSEVIIIDDNGNKTIENQNTEESNTTDIKSDNSKNEENQKNNSGDKNKIFTFFENLFNGIIQWFKRLF